MNREPLTPEERAGDRPVTVKRAAQHFRWRYADLLDLAKSGQIRAYLPPGRQSGWRVFVPELQEDCRNVGRKPKAPVPEEESAPPGELLPGSGLGAEFYRRLRRLRAASAKRLAEEGG